MDPNISRAPLSAWVPPGTSSIETYENDLSSSHYPTGTYVIPRIHYIGRGDRTRFVAIDRRPEVGADASAGLGHLRWVAA